MTRLQTYFAILVAIFTFAGGLFAYGLTIVAGRIGISSVLLVMWGIMLMTTIAFILSMYVGHTLGDPFRTLHLQIRSLINGDARVVIRPDGRLKEADILAADISTLAEADATRITELTVQQKRQNQFISDVAHELRTPLTAIHGNAETLMDPDMPESFRQRFLTTIINESDRLTRITNDLLTLQHIENDATVPILERVQLRPLAENVADALHSLIEDRDGTIQVVGETLDVLGNPDRLQQAIYNLAANACRFIGQGGHVVIRLEGLQGQSIISVMDDGPGFGDTDPQMLFTRFFRGDNSRARNTGGTGLGLSIVKGIVDAHDGTVTAFNRAEGGACFVISLPSIHEHVR